MNIGIIGSGGREHALCAKLKVSKIVNKIFCLPGNAGTHQIAKNIDVNISDFKAIRSECEKNKIELLVVGPEKPLVDGIVDFFQDTEIKIFGPNKLASQLEGSKTFTKKLCKKYNIPTSKFEIFDNKKDAVEYLLVSNYPLVVKADGLAAGKGVYICNTKHDAVDAINEIFDGKFGEAKIVLVEEFLAGEEMSYFIISDGQSFSFFQTAQDHKRVGEGDTGSNTGGMGAYSPSRLNTNQLEKKIKARIIEPTLKGLNDLGTEYVGFLYVGLMIVRNEPYLIEFNVRMGDPECQTILPLLKSDLGEIIHSCCEKKLKFEKLEWLNQKSICFVLCSNGYPNDYKKNIKIHKLKNFKIEENKYIYHAGTQLLNNEYYSVGGRVLNVVVTSNDFKNCKDEALKILNNLDWKEGFYRRDIGYKVTE